MYTTVFYANIYQEFLKKIGFRDKIKAADIRGAAIHLKKETVDSMSKQELVAKVGGFFIKGLQSNHLRKGNQSKKHNVDCNDIVICGDVGAYCHTNAAGMAPA